MNDDDSRPRQQPDHSKIVGQSHPDDEPLSSSTCAFESFDYDPAECTYRALFETDEISPSEAVVGAVSAVADLDPLEIEQLGSKVDADALNTVLSPRRGPEGDVHVTFTLQGYDVTLSSYGSVVVRQPRSGERDDGLSANR